MITSIPDRKKRARSFGTHSGTFHADEVTACALLCFFDLIDKDKIVRTRDLGLLKECEYVCDVGGVYSPEDKLFDHHQVDYRGELSSAGMILLYLRDQKFIQDFEYLFLNNALIQGIDAHDNGKDFQIPGVCSFSHVISNFMPIVHETDSESQDLAFQEALKFAIGHLERLWHRFQYVHSCKRMVAECMERYRNCLIFDRGIPWLENFFELGGANHPALFVVMPSGPHWKLRGIPPTYEDRMRVRLSLPKEWAGLLEESLKKVSGIPGAVFCHKGLFTSVWETKEDALKALEYVLKNAGRTNDFSV
jgi:uncharacterized UPF0160 family protein